MADVYFEGLWDDVVKEIQEVFSIDRKFLRTKVFPERDKAYNTLQNNYIRYASIINKLGECYSQIIQPQERSIIKLMLDSCIGRLLEIKFELTDVDKTDFIYMDNNLIQMKKTISDLEITVPEYYRTDRIERIEAIDLIITHALKEKARKEELKSMLAAAPPAKAKESPAEGDTQADEQAQADGQGVEPSRESSSPVFDDDSKFARRSRSLSRRATVDQLAKRPKFKVIEISEEQKAYMAAVRLIQRHERARVDRLQVQLVLEKKRLMEDIAWLRHKPIPEDVKLKVSKIIQRYWARYKLRRHQTFVAVRRNISLGLLEPSWRPGNELRMTVEELGANRRKAQAAAWEAMEDAAVAARIRMEKNSEKICESIVDELRYWIYQWYKGMEATGHPQLPAFPDAKPIIPPPSILGIPKDTPDGMAEKLIQNVANTIAGRVLEPIGGSALIVAGHWIPVDIFAVLFEQVEKSKSSPKAEKKKPSKKELKEKLKKEREIEAKRLSDLKKEGFVPAPSKFMDSLDASVKDYLIDWESRTVSRKHEQTLVDLDVAKRLHLDLRQQVDDDMRLELERLQTAIDLDRGIVAGPKKEAKEKKAKKKKGKKDPLKNMTEEEIIADLAGHGMIAKYKRLFFIDLPGCLSLSNYEARNKFFEDPSPQWGDFKQVVKEYCVLHLGSNFTHLKAPLIRSVLLCGPIQIIEDYADVICTESGAVRFVLNPLTLPLTAYKKKLFDHIFAKIPRQLKPAVILIPGAEKIFYKNVPKEEKDLNPKALAKVFPKMVKAIKPGDQILILGLSDQPWASTANKMLKAFDRVICFPDMDYQTLSRFWAEGILKYHGVNRYFDITALTTMTKGYGMKVLESKLEEVMSTDKILSLKNSPLKEREICLDLPRLDEKAATNSWDWCQKSVKLYIQRKNQLAKDAEKRAKEAKGGQKKDDKKKPKKKEPTEKEIIDNRLLSRAINRPVTSCCPWAPQRQIDAMKGPLTSLNDLEYTKCKEDLYRNEKSLEQFPIRKPFI